MTEASSKTDPSFEVGQSVLVLKLKKKGSICQRLGSGKYVVSLGSISITCSQAEISALPKENTGKKAKRNPAFLGNPDVSIPSPAQKARDRVDLHGMRVREALDLVDQVINDAILEDLLQIDIIHGIGEGKIRQALHTHLAGMRVVKRYLYDPANPGVTKVFF